jgi:D-3-phosphoglycerate dehydrogenase
LAETKRVVLVLEPVDEAGLRRMEEAGLEIRRKWDLDPAAFDASLDVACAIVIRSASTIDRDFLAKMPRLRAVARAGVGLDNVDMAEATRHGVAVLNTPGGNATAAAEHALALMLALARHVPAAHASVASGQWDRQRFVGVELSGKLLGVLGLGRVGTLVARRAQAFGMEVWGHDPYLSEERARSLGIRKAELDEILPAADFLSLHLPLTEATRHLIGPVNLAKMKPEAMLVNCARGGLVDEEALAAALREGRLAAAGIDVFASEPPKNSPLVGLANVVHTPHLGASTREAKENVSQAIAQGLIALLLHDDYSAAVNLPFEGADLAELAPWLDLARRMGRLQGNLLTGAPTRCEAVLAADGDASEPAPLAAAFLSGLLEVVCGGEVNAINAQQKADELGIAVSSGRAPAAKEFPRLLTTRVESGEGRHEVSGAFLGPGSPRIVRVDDYWLDLEPAGNWLLMENEDVPGVVGKVGTLLGASGINIGELRLGRASGAEDHRAISVWQVDEPVGADVVGRLEEIPRIYGVRQLSLGAPRSYMS